MMKKIILMLIVISILSSVLCGGASALVLSDGYSDEPILYAITEYGWVTFTISAHYNEYYNAYSNYNEFYRRTKWMYVTSSRDDAPVSVFMAPVITHYTSSGSVMKKFSDFTNVAEIFAPGFFARTYKENTESMSYPLTTTNYGTCAISITGGAMPWSHEFVIDLATA